MAIGVTSHRTFGPKNKLMVFDVWTSKAAFDRFGKTLVPILQQIGRDSGQPQVMDVHKVILPAPKVAVAKKRKKACREAAEAPVSAQGREAPPGHGRVTQYRGPEAQTG